jgi:hypothetical protein
MPDFYRFLLIALLAPMLIGNLCAEVVTSPTPASNSDTHHELIVSLRDQKLLLLQDGKPDGVFPVSTSRFGVGDRWGSFATPLGKLLVRIKIGMGKPLGTVFHSRVPTGEVLKPNAPGRDPIVTRILWLEGTEPGNKNAFARGIYIHGTPQEKFLGRPASYGCIRMRSTDVATLCDRVGVGAVVRIIPDHLPIHRSFLQEVLNSDGFVASDAGTPE